MEAWVAQFRDHGFKNRKRNAGQHSCKSARSTRSAICWLPTWNPFPTASSSYCTSTRDLFGVTITASWLQLAEKLPSLLEERRLFIATRRKEKAITHIQEGLEWMMSEPLAGTPSSATRGWVMNDPDQMWESTMDPESRRMLRVKY